MSAVRRGAAGPVTAAIDHIVVLALENRSFDHVLGDLARTGGIKADGGRSDMSNADVNGREIRIGPAAEPVAPDLPHEFSSVLLSQMEGQGGFVRADQLTPRKSRADPRRVMSYYPAGTLPVTHLLAAEYAVSDAWFASVPAGTWPNRMFMVAATSGGRVTNTAPGLLFDFPTVFDRLDGDDWVIYNDQIPNVALIRSLAAEWAVSRINGRHFRSTRRYEQDCADGTLPYFSFIEPVYLGGKADDAHPPHDINRSEQLVGRVYRALRQSPLWARSALVVTYDEHGGLFDHVPPPPGVPEMEAGEFGFTFARLGVRVPTLIVSPLVSRGLVWRPPTGGFADHSSIVATVLRNRDLEALTARDASAADILGAFTVDARTDDSETAARIDRWVTDQEAVVTRDWVSPIDPEALQDGNGREVAAAIVASAGAQAVPSRAFQVFGAGGPSIEPGFHGLDAVTADVPFEEALVDLARRVLALPPEDEPAGEGELVTR
jgi:phospholipase C